MSGLEPSWCAGIIGPSFWQDATSPLPVFHFHAWLQSSTDIPGDTMQNQPRSDLALAVSGFGQTDPVQKQAGVQESSGPLLAIASELIQIRCELDPACLLSLLALPLQLQWPFTIWPCPGVVNLVHCPDITVPVGWA